MFDIFDDLDSPAVPATVAPPAAAVLAPPVAVPVPSVVEGHSPGCFSLELSSSEYHSLPDSVSTTGLKKLLRSPAHFQAYLNDHSPSENDDLGTAVHAAVLEPERFAREYAFYDGYRRGGEWAEFKQANRGKTILTVAEGAQVSGMVDALKGFDDYPVWAALQRAQREMSVFWTDEETGVACRVRFDALCAPFANWDLKSTTDARPQAFVHQAIRLDYDLQAYMYSEAARRFVGKDIPFIFVAIETNRPHGVWLHTAGQTMLENGRLKFRKALELYRKCVSQRRWPGYENAISTMELPRYALVSK